MSCCIRNEQFHYFSTAYEKTWSKIGTLVAYLTKSSE